MLRITGVKPNAGCRLEVELSNGNSVILNFLDKLQTVRFGLLADEAFFRRAVTDGDFVRWDNKIEISVSEVFQLAQKEMKKYENIG